MKNSLILIMTVSIAFQVLAAVMAVRLIPRSGAFLAWIFLACGFIAQAIRRLVALLHVLNGQSLGDLAVEVMGLLISLLMLCGIWKFGPLFSEIKRSRQAMSEKEAELRELNRQLEADAAERQRVEDSLRESEELYRAVAEYSYDWEYWIDSSSNFRYISPYCKEVSGYDRDEFYRDPHLLKKIIHPDDSNIYKKHFEENLSCEEFAEPIDFRIITRDGQERWIGHVCRPVLDSHGNWNGRRASNRDITDRKILEQHLHALNSVLEERVTERTAELARLNKELESFCYAISHELRAPIARLQAFSRVLAEEVGTARPDELSHLAERIGVSSLRLRAVIDALLEMNRLTRADLDRERIDLSAMARQIMNELLEEAGKRAVCVSIAPGLVARGDRSMLEICLQNLLDNALKFTAGTPAASVEVGQIRQERATVYFVSDNGAGFDMTFADKLFEPFCRLHNDSEFAGDGIGLATVHRIIERHGGKIWAESAPGKGATFFFTLGD